ncbi:MAG: class I SAM-dependent methyltransferase [Calditrichaeota bacterium]|nr:class I SAM-dependent methyltransferase [Calditrichota bacterium]
MTNLRWRLKRWFILLRDSFPVNSILKRENKNFRTLLSATGAGPQRVLDLGVGTGNVLRQFSDSFQCFAIDFTFSMLKTTKKNFPAAHLAQADANILPFKSEIFALVTAVGLLEYIEDTIPLFNEVCRVLKKKGFFIFTFAPKNLWSCLRILLGHQIRMRKLEQINSLANICEFELVEVRHTIMQVQVLIKKQ